jgi:hypothetical protein
MKIGILHQLKHSDTTTFFTNIISGLKNTFNDSDFFHIESLQQLISSDISCLFILHEHHNAEIWADPNFINHLNSKNIRVIAFNYEKIFNSHFPWNEDIQNKFNTIHNKYQFIADIDDLHILKDATPCKQFISRDTKLQEPIPWEEKADKLLFLGCIYGEQYQNRSCIIEDIKKINLPIEFEAIVTNNTLSYNEFINKINSVKYILNPFGTGTFVNIRHYEARHLNTVVIQQVTDKLLHYYPELLHTCRTFKTVNEIPNLLNTPFTPSKEIFLEDYYQEINLKSFIQ